VELTAAGDGHESTITFGEAAAQYAVAAPLGCCDTLEPHHHHHHGHPHHYHGSCHAQHTSFVATKGSGSHKQYVFTVTVTPGQISLHSSQTGWSAFTGSLGGHSICCGTGAFTITASSLSGHDATMTINPTARTFSMWFSCWGTSHVWSGVLPGCAAGCCGSVNFNLTTGDCNYSSYTLNITFSQSGTVSIICPAWLGHNEIFNGAFPARSLCGTSAFTFPANNHGSYPTYPFSVTIWPKSGSNGRVDLVAHSGLGGATWTGYYSTDSLRCWTCPLEMVAFTGTAFYAGHAANVFINPGGSLSVGFPSLFGGAAFSGSFSPQHLLCQRGDFAVTATHPSHGNAHLTINPSSRSVYMWINHAGKNVVWRGDFQRRRAPSTVQVSTRYPESSIELR
jgi:hypothetical protein